MKEMIEKDLKPIEEHIQTQINKNNNRIIYFDILNILACICVVFLHMNGIVHSYSTSRAWKTALVFEVVCYWAVPIFVMLSGATLFKYRERYDTKTFFKKRFVKVLIPWIIWSLILFIIKNKNLNIMQFIKDFSYCKIESIYWFFPLILFLYCLIPIFSIFTEKKEYTKILKAIVIFQFAFKGLIYPICVVTNTTFPTIFSYCTGMNSYIIFLILGYLLSTENLTKKQRIILYSLGIVSLFVRYFYTYYFSIKDGVINKDLFDYCSGISVLLAAAVFVFVKNINWENVINKLHIKPEIISKISSCSFGIYLIHMLIKNKLTSMLELNVYSFWYRTLGAICLYLVCLIIVYIIKKIPIVRKIVP